MTPIKNIGNLPPEFRRTERNEKQSSAKRSDDVKAQDPQQVDNKQQAPHDQVNVSDSARTMLQRDAEVERYRAELPSVETISPEEKQDIEAKIESGYYSSPEVISEIAGKIAQESVKASEVESTKRSLTPTRMQEVMENIRKNLYESNDVIDVIASKVLKDL